jgi:hypothetical protein
MATLINKLTLTSNDAVSDAINITLSDILTVTDPIEMGKRNVTTAVAGGGEFVAAADSNTYYVYLKNLDTTNFVYVQDAAAATFGKLFPGEFMWFTLAPSEGMELRADTDTVKVQYGLFKKG